MDFVISPLRLINDIGMGIILSLQWRHNMRDGVANRTASRLFAQPFFTRRSKNTPKLRVTGLCEGNAPVTGGFSIQKASNAENISIKWRHHVWNEIDGIVNVSSQVAEI